MQTSVDQDDEALLIGQQLWFDIRENRLSNVVRPEYQVELDRAQAQILLQLVRAPQVVLRRPQVLETLWNRYDMTVSEQTLDELVSALRAALRTLDPGSVYIRTLPRLGYVLVSTVTPRIN